MNFLAHLFAGPERLLPLLVPRLASAVADGETSVPASLPGARWALTFDEGQSSRPLRQARAAQFGLTPETAFSRAHANLRRVASPADLLPHPSDPLLRVCALPDGSGPNRLLALDLVLPEADPVLGVLAAVPTTDLLLLHVVTPDSSAAPVVLHRMARRVFAPADNPLSDRVFWWRPGSLDTLELVSDANQIQWTAGSVTEAFWAALSSASPGA